MNNCKDCRALWPFGFALLLAMLVSFPAWATLNLMDLHAGTQLAGAALVFCAVATGLLLYVRWCIKRNCVSRRAATAPRQGRELASASR